MRSYSLVDVHRILNERGLVELYVATDEMSYFIQFNSREKLLWIKGRKNEGPYKEFGKLPLNATAIKQRFQDGVSEVVITSLGSEFGDDGYDYYAELGKSAEVGSGITNEHRENYRRILQAIGTSLSP